MHIEKYTSDNTNRTKIQIGKFNSEIQIGTYKSGKHKSEIQHQKILTVYYESKKNTDRENTIWKRHIWTYKSENAIRENKSDITNRKVHVGNIIIGKYQLKATNQKIQIGKIQIGKYKSQNTIRKTHSVKYDPELTNRIIQVEKYKSAHTNRKIQIGKYKSENTKREMQLGQYN